MRSEDVLFKKRMKISRWLLLASAPVLLFFRPVWEPHTLAHEAMEIVGHSFMFLGIMIRVYTSLYSGGRKNEVLLTDGPYSIVRNPLYVGSFFAVMGVSMQTCSILLTCIATLTFVLIHTVTVAREERYLHERYSLVYERYLQTVNRWLPNFSAWRYPDELLVKPRLVMSTMRDASLFFVGLLFIEALCALRADDFLPVLLTLH